MIERHTEFRDMPIYENYILAKSMDSKLTYEDFLPNKTTEVSKDGLEDALKFLELVINYNY